MKKRAKSKTAKGAQMPFPSVCNIRFNILNRNDKE
jgi:hypothetical protein